MRVERLLNLKIIRWERDNQKENIRMLFVFSIRLNGRVAICTPFGGTVPHFDLLYPTKICTPRVRILVPHLNLFHFKLLMNHLLAELRKTACRSLSYFLEM